MWNTIVVKIQIDTWKLFRPNYEIKLWCHIIFSENCYARMSCRNLQILALTFDFSFDSSLDRYDFGFVSSGNRPPPDPPDFPLSIFMSNPVRSRFGSWISWRRFDKSRVCMNRNNVVETDTRAISSLTLKKKNVFLNGIFFTLGNCNFTTFLLFFQKFWKNKEVRNYMCIWSSFKFWVYAYLKYLSCL